MKKRQKIFAFFLASMLSVSSFFAYAQKTTATESSLETMTEEEQRKEEAKQYLEENGVWTTSENMKFSITLPDETWEQNEEGMKGYEGNFVSGENVMELQIFEAEDAKLEEQDLPADKEEFQSMVEEGIEVIQFEVEITEEKTVIKTILKFSQDEEEEIYQYAVSCQIYKGERYLEASAHTDDENIIYILLESISSAELL